MKSKKLQPGHVRLQIKFIRLLPLVVVVVVVGIRPGDIFICWHGNRLPFSFVMVNDGKLHSPRRTDKFVVICVEESPENT